MGLLEDIPRLRELADPAHPDYDPAYARFAASIGGATGGRAVKPHYRNLDEAIRAKQNCRECKEKK